MSGEVTGSQGRLTGGSKKQREERKEEKASTYPSEELVPLEDRPDNVFRLLLQAIGSSVSNRWSYVSVPVTEEEFQEFSKQFRKFPFVVAPNPLTPGAVPVTPEDVIKRIRMEHRHFKEDAVIKDRNELDRYTKIAEMIALDLYPQGREVGYQRMLNYFTEVYAKEMARLEEELTKVTEGREEVDERTEKEIMEKIRDLQAKERGFGTLLQVRQKLLEDVKEYMRERWKAVEDMFDGEFLEALKKIGDANVEGYDGVGIPQKVWDFRKALAEEFLKFKKDMTELFNDPNGDGFKPYREFEAKYGKDPRYQSIKEKLVRANGTFQPYVSYFAGITVELEERLKPLVEKYAEEIVGWREELSERYEALKEEIDYCERIGLVLGEALKEEDPKKALERIATDEGREERDRETATALLSYLSQVEGARRGGKVVSMEGKEVATLPEPELDGEFSPHLREALRNVVIGYEGSVVPEGRELLSSLRSLADERHARLFHGIGGERSELSVLGEQIAVARSVAGAVETMREKLRSGISAVDGMDENQVASLNRNLKYRFMMGREMGREHEYHRAVTNLRSFYNLELLMEKLMAGELTPEDVEAVLEEPEFGIGEYVRRKFGRDAFLDVKEALTDVARRKYEGKNLVPYHLNPDEYVRAIRDYVAMKKIRGMVKEEGVGRYFGQSVVSRFFTFALTPLGLKPYTVSKKFETCVRQALYPDTSAMNYAPSHRLKTCMEAFQNELNSLSGRHADLSRAILNGSPLHFPLAPLGIYLAFLSNYVRYKAKMVESDVVELDREIDRVVKEKLLSASSTAEMDENVKNYFYDELGIRVSVVPRGSLPSEERKIKAKVLLQMAKGDGEFRREVKRILRMADEAGLVSGDAPYVRRLLEKPAWDERDAREFLKLMEKIERTYTRMVRDRYQVPDREWRKTLDLSPEKAQKVLENSASLKTGRTWQFPEGKRVRSPGGVSLNRGITPLMGVVDRVRRLRERLDFEYNSRTYSLASENSVFLVTVNPEKLKGRNREHFETLRRRFASATSPEEKAVLRRERENFFLRRLGLDANSIREMMDKGILKNGMEYEHVFSKVLGMKEYDLFFEGEGVQERREERERVFRRTASGPRL